MARLFSVLGVLWMATVLFVLATGEDSGELAASTLPTTVSTSPSDTTVSVASETTTAENPTTQTTEGIPGTRTTTSTAETGTTTSTAETGTTTSTAETGTTTSTAETPATGETEKPGTDKPPVTTKPNPCDSNPCGGGSTCEARANNTFICLCLPGDSYIEEAKMCLKAKVFPGQVTLNDLTYDSAMNDKTSATFKDASDKIINAMHKAFISNDAYIGCVVLEFRAKQTRMTRAIVAEAVVDLSFSSDSDATQEAVETSIKDCKDCGVLFFAKNLCDRQSCDETSTNCIPSDGSFSCDCQDGYIKSGYTERLCLACPSGEKAVNSQSCERCSFGYSGFNCSENWQLILVIVGAVLGALTLSFLIALIVVSVKSPKKKSKKSKEAEDVKPYISHFSTKAPLGGNSMKNDYTSQTNAPAGVPRIPRATTTLDNRSNMEMMPTNSRQNLISSNSWQSEDQDGGYSYSRPNNSYAQNRPQSNPYNQNRAQYNPYAQNQGHSNPYYKD